MIIQALKRQNPHTLSIGVIAILHTVGLFGLNSAWQDLFLWLTPFNLIISALIVYRRHLAWTKPELLVMLFCFALGYGIELAGVHTGVIFGEYAYGTGFGFKIAEVPPLIGLNWAVLVYGSSMIAVLITSNRWGQILLSAALMTGLDYIMEPMAIRLGFWDWVSTTIPIRNYIAWFATSLVMHFFWFRHNRSFYNPTAVAFFIVQVLFFLLLRLF